MDDSIVVTYKYLLPEHKEELYDAQHATSYSMALDEIYNICRNVWKYEDEPSSGRVKLAEEIARIVNESGAMDEI